MVSNKSQIWTASSTTDELSEGTHYASISLPWTFDRMMMNSSPDGQKKRAYNIAKGIVGQEVLVRVLSEKGVDIELPNDTHRDDDIFDIRLNVDGQEQKADLKTMNYFSDYENDRTTFSLEYLIDNRDYDGSKWNQFFPMMIPHTQMNQNKEVYIFAIAESIDFRNKLWEGRSEHAIFAFPHGEMCEFTQKEQLINAREEEYSGIFFSIEYDTPSYFEKRLPKIELIGEWDGEIKRQKVTLEKNETISHIGPFSALNSLWMSTEDFREHFSGSIHFSISKNELQKPVRNTTRRDLNTLPRNRDEVDPKRPMTIEKSYFCNLRLPDDYTIHYLGWTTKEDFITNCRKYRSWIWPDDDVDPDKNMPWSQLTEDDQKKLERIGFDDEIQQGDHRIDAGFLKGIPIGGSAATFVYPNQYGGGLRETNAYVLPQDLRSMAELVPSG